MKTAHQLAEIVQNKFEAINIDEINQEFADIKKYDCGRISDEWQNKKIENEAFVDWIKSCSELETYLRANLGTFTETELVYKWAKVICMRRNELLSTWRSGYSYISFVDYLNKYNR
jgi:hypothetical protein